MRALTTTPLPPLDTLTVGALLGVGLLPTHRAVLDDVAARAAREEAVEARLATIAAEWGAAVLTFAEYKGRGEMVLKLGEKEERREEGEERARQPP